MNNVGLENLAEKVLNDKQVLSELLEGILSKKDTIRHNRVKILLLLSEKKPEFLYHQWEFFVKLIDVENSYLKLIAVRIIANLTKVDREDKFNKIFEKYYDLLNDSVIVAGHLTANSGRIVKAKPELQIQITNKLLNIDDTHQKHKDLVKAGDIETFNEYFEEVEDKEKILQFVKEQLNSKSPKTRKKAKEFLKKWETRQR